MIRYLLLILFIVLVIFATRALRRLGRHDGTHSGSQATGADGPEEGGAMMLACAQCGLHLPPNEALPGKTGVYCSEAHRAMAEARDGDS